MFRKFSRMLQSAQHSSPSGANWTRRQFLQTAAASAGSIIAIDGVAAALDRPQPQIAIIGGGLAGLNAAYRLKQRGYKSTVYEGRNRLGGRVLSSNKAIGKDLTIDIGGHYINSEHADMRSLVKELGLTLVDLAKQAQTVGIPETIYFFNDRRFTEAELVKYLQPLARQIGNDAALIEKDFDRYGAKLDRLSVTDYLKLHARKIPNPVVTALITLVIRSEYGVEPDRSSVLQLLTALPTVKGEKVDLLAGSDEAFTVKEGTGAIIDRLAGKLSGQIQLNQKLQAIRSRGSGFELTFANGTSVNADYVILALPSTVLRKLALNVKLPALLRRSIREVDLGKNEKLYAGYQQRIWQQQNGFTNELWSDLGFCEVWEETARQFEGSDGALTFYFGGAELTSLTANSTLQLGQKSIDLLAKVLPASVNASSGKFFQTQWSNDPFTGGSYSNYRPGQITEFAKFRYVESKQASQRQNVAVGNLVFAGEQFSDEYYGYMNGAAQTGRLAAAVVANKIKSRSRSKR